MDTNELESILEGGAETQRVDFKAPMEWDELSFAKDILAISNVADGGYLIIGVSEDKKGGFVRSGITQPQKKSFQIDVMKDQMTKFADPHVEFAVFFPQDLQGKTYAVISIKQFEEIPVICRRDSKDTKAGTLYYRNRNRRIESAPISNSYDLREIIEMATVRMMRKKQSLGYLVDSDSAKKFSDELEGL